MLINATFLLLFIQFYRSAYQRGAITDKDA
jgi:hypothetical protein